MADDLDDDWWVKEDIEDEEGNDNNEKPTPKKKKKKKHNPSPDIVEDLDGNIRIPKKDKNVIKGAREEIKENTKVKKKVKRKVEETSDHVSTTTATKKKRKKKKKHNQRDEYEPTIDALWRFFQEEVQKSLSSIEINDIKPENDDWYLKETETFVRDDPEQFSPYLKNVSPTWGKTCSILTKKERKGSPALLILTSSAQRAVDLLRHASAFKGDDCKSVKLFAKHFKVDDQVKYLDENVVHLAVGTPHRVLTLIENSSLKIKKLKYLIIDWSWKDVKTRQIFNMPNVKDDFVLLFQKYFFSLCQKGTLSVGLF